MLGVLYCSMFHFSGSQYVCPAFLLDSCSRSLPFFCFVGYSLQSENAFYRNCFLVQFPSLVIIFFFEYFYVGMKQIVWCCLSRN